MRTAVSETVCVFVRLAGVPRARRECVMAFMRVPSLDEEFGRDAAMGLNSLGWGKDLLGRALGRDAEGRLVS